MACAGLQVEILKGGSSLHWIQDTASSSRLRMKAGSTTLKSLQRLQCRASFASIRRVEATPTIEMLSHPYGNPRTPSESTAPIRSYRRDSKLCGAYPRLTRFCYCLPLASPMCQIFVPVIQDSRTFVIPRMSWLSVGLVCQLPQVPQFY